MVKIIYTFKNQEILVDDCDYSILNQYKWNVDKDNLVCTTLPKFFENTKTKTISIHRFIYKFILKMEIKGILIGHLDGDNLNNIRLNLEYDITRSKILRLSHKNNSDRCIYKIKSGKRFLYKVNFRINYISLVAYYENKENAQYQLKLWVIEHSLQDCYTVDKFKKPKNFILYKKKQKNDLYLPKGITKRERRNKCYAVRFYIFGIKNKKEKYFKILEEAIEFQNKMKNQFEIDKEDKILNTSIIRNEDGDAIILTNKKGEIIVDDDDYYDLSHQTWMIDDDGYAKTNLKKKLITKLVTMTHYIMKTDKIVDHIDGNRVNNKKENLRIVTLHQNNMNKTKTNNTTSKYIGVYWDKNRNKWAVRIKEKFIGRFDTEIQAAKERDIATKKYFGEYGKLNFPN